MQKLKRPWGDGESDLLPVGPIYTSSHSTLSWLWHLHCCGQLEPKSDAAPNFVASLWTVVAFHWQVPEVGQSKPLKVIVIVPAACGLL